jgi:chitin synthase
VSLQTCSKNFPSFYTDSSVFPSSSVLDFSLLRWLDREFVDYPPIFDDLARGNTSYEGRDSTMQLLSAGNRTLAECMDDIIRVGFVDSKTIGCVVADIVLYVSLVFILAVVGIKFAMAVIYSWFFGRRLGAFKSETKEERAKKIQEVENWTKDIYRPAPSSYRPNVKNARKSYLPTTSRFTAPVSRPYSTFDTGKRQSTFGSKNLLGAGLKGSPPDSPLRSSRSNASLPLSSMNVSAIENAVICFPLIPSFMPLLD